MGQDVVEKFKAGMEGLVVNETAVANVEGVDGDGGLEYRGYRIEDLAASASFTETAYLLLYGDLPTAGQLQEFDERLRAKRTLPETLVKLLPEIPQSATAMDVLRTSVSVMAHFDPEVNVSSGDHAANVRKAETILAMAPTAVAYRDRIKNGKAIVEPRADLDHSANFLWMVNGEVPSESVRSAFDLSLVLYAEHELNASTFSARITVSTLTDIYSGIVAAIGTLKGPLHGGANEEAWKLLERVGSPEKAAGWIDEALGRGEKIMGFGHRVYKTGDPRARILKVACERIAKEIGEERWEQIAGPIEEAVTARKKLPPNVDWPSARLYHYMGLDLDVYTPIFAMARISGWSAHIIEQLDNNRLMRPRSRYVGPPNRPVKGIGQR